MPNNRRRIRNPVARSPLLRKGGPHQTSRSGERQQQRHAVQDAWDEWWDEYRELNDDETESVPDGTDSPRRRPQRYAIGHSAFPQLLPSESTFHPCP